MFDRLSPSAWNRILGLALGALALFAAAALALPADSHLTGPVGEWLRGLLRAGFGATGAWLVPALLLVWSLNRVRRAPVWPLAARSALFTALAIVLVSWIALLHGSARVARGYGGAVGTGIARSARGTLGPVGGYLVLGVAALALLIVAFEVTWPRLVEATGRWVARGARRGGALGLRGAVWSATRTGRFLREAGAALLETLRPGPRRSLPAAEVPEPARASLPEPATVPAPAPVAAAAPPARAQATAAPSKKEQPAANGKPVTGRAAQRTLADHTPPVAGPPAQGPADLPPTTLLLRTPTADHRVDEAAIADAGRLLEQRLREFAVEGRVTRWNPGPVITTYEVEPGPGVRVSSFVSRSDDIALGLRVDRVRIVAPLPGGRGAVGVEVPNREPQLVRLGDVVVAQEFVGSQAALPLPLGLDTAGKPTTTDLAKMPHLLVAGATGSGKSTCINAILVGLLLKRRPSELRLILVDPKMLELSTFAGVPHLLMPVVTEIRKEAPKALLWLVQEMEDRYRLLAARGARHIDTYNASLRKEENASPLPYIVLVIDELADLMLVAGREVEDSIARLAQMARAVGIHLVLATQRPSVDVITGVIKANFPSRIAFQVATKVDSRTILDVNGAESLLGRGDMLFLPSGRSDPLRVHGAFVSEAECDALAAWLRENVPAPPAIDLDKALRSAAGDEGPGEVDDELFDEAARLVLTHRLGSTSFLQRRLKVGYSRAGRLMDLLEEHGVVGAGDGSKPREVLLDMREWEERRAALQSLDD